jgi:hypothetical protein
MIRFPRWSTIRSSMKKEANTTPEDNRDNAICSRSRIDV